MALECTPALAAVNVPGWSRLRLIFSLQEQNDARGLPLKARPPLLGVGLVDMPANNQAGREDTSILGTSHIASSDL